MVVILGYDVLMHLLKKIAKMDVYTILEGVKTIFLSLKNAFSILKRDPSSKFVI